MRHVYHAMLIGGLMLLLPLGLGGCGSEGSDGDGASRYTIVTTTGMIRDIAHQVAGERAEVIGIMKEGVDPHLYQPNTEAIAQLSAADVIFYNGLMLEGKMADVLQRQTRKNPNVYAVTEGLRQRADYVMTDEENYYDPHVWMDVRGWIHAVRFVAEVLSEYDPDHAEQYQTNAERYTAKLEHLDAYAREAIGSIPEPQRVLVTAHDAFGYMGRAYGIEVQGIQGLSTESEAGLKRVNALAKMLAERDIRAVFIESSVPQKAVRSLIEGAKANYDHDVRIGGELYSDAMGPRGTYEGTYIGMIDHNVTTIAKALGGDAPEGGFQDYLESRETVAE